MQLDVVLKTRLLVLSCLEDQKNKILSIFSTKKSWELLLSILIAVNQL